MKSKTKILAIQKPLSSIKLVTEDLARMIVWERARSPFRSAEDFVQRVRLSSDIYESIALSGALDSLEGNARRALWIVSMLSRTPASLFRRDSNEASLLNQDHYVSSLHAPISEELIPYLPPIKAQERLAYDYITHGAARVHPMSVYRRMLTDLEIRPIEIIWTLLPTIPHSPDSKGLDPKSPRILVAGIVILRQSPPTAHGVLFVTIEDETGFVQCIVQPREREIYDRELRYAALIVKADVIKIGDAQHGTHNGWRGLIVREVRVLSNVNRGIEESRNRGIEDEELKMRN